MYLFGIKIHIFSRKSRRRFLRATKFRWIIIEADNKEVRINERKKDK